MSLDWDAVDKARLGRHEQLLKIWRHLPSEELLADMVILAQLTAFAGLRERREMGGDCVCRTPDCGHPAMAHVGNRCVMCGRIGCWS